MIRNCTLLLFVIIAFTSCKKTKEDLLCRKWQQVSYQNANRDIQDKEWSLFIDTFGRTTSPEIMMQTYGFTNVDSFKRSMEDIRNEYKAAEQKNIENTQFDFRKNGIVFITSGEVKDSASWKFDGENKILFDEKKLKGVGSQLHFEVVSLTDTGLKIKFVENSSSAIANFVPAKK